MPGQTEEVGFKISVDTTDGNRSVGDIRQELKDAEAAVKALETEFGAMSEQATEARAKMAGVAKEVEKIDGKSIKSLKAELKEAQVSAVAMVRQFGEFSPQAISAAQNLGSLRDEMADLTELSNALTEENRFAAFANFGGSLAAGFTAAQGAIGLVSSDTQELEKVIAKVNSAMAFSQGLQGVAQLGKSFKTALAALQSFTFAQKANSAATSAAAVVQKLFTGSVDTTSLSFKVLKGAIIATGIGALVVAVGYVINNFDKLKETVFKLLPFLETVSKFIGNIVDAVTDFVGITSEAGRQADKLKESIEGQNTQFDRQIELMEANGATSKQISKQKLAQLDAEISKLQEVGRLNGKNSDDEKKRLDELQFQRKLINATQDKQDRDDAKAAGDKARENSIKATEAVIENLKARHAAEIAEYQAQGKDITELRQKQIDAEIALLKKSGSKYNTAILVLGAEKKKNAKEAEEELKEGLKKDSDRLIELLKDQHRREIEAAQARGEDTQKLREQQIEDEIYSLKNSKQNYAAAIEELENEKLRIQAQAQAKQQPAADKAAAEKEKKEQEQQARIQSRKELAAEFDQNAALQQLTDKYDAMRMIAQDNETLLTAISEKEAEERQQIKAKFANLEIQTEQMKGEAVAGLLGKASDIVGKQTAVGKGLAIAEATIATYLGATKALAASAGAGPFGVAVGIAQAALVIATGFKNIKEILKTKVPGSASGNSAAPSLAGSSPALSTTPTLSGIQSTLVDNTQQIANNREALKAYVVESEVTQAQERAKSIVQTATF